MNRVAFKMKLKKGFEEEYKKRHDEIWPELHELLRGQGISNYSIFFDEETGFLFGFQNVNGDSGSQDLGQNPIVKKWWDFMADIMEVNEDNSPITTPLRELFYFKK
ncbi:MAG: L-rhamnose mutarotase [Spirochaetaceae bacterium]